MSVHKDIAGSVLVEAALGIWMLIILVIGIFDVGRMLHAHIVLTQAAHEGGRLGSRIGGLSTVASGYGHDFIEARVRGALAIHQGIGIDINAVDVSSECVPSPVKHGALIAHSDSVEISITAEYDGFFPVFNGVPLRVFHSVSFLAGSNCA